MRQECGEDGQSKQPVEVPEFLSRQPPRSDGESLLRRIFARQTTSPRWRPRAHLSQDSQ
jgi:hypothetical protein